MTRRITVYDLQIRKARTEGRARWLQFHVDQAEKAAAAVEAGISILSCETDHHLDGIRTAAPTAFVSVRMSHGAVASPEEAGPLGFRLLKRGADAAYCPHSPFFIVATARGGIPVTGHVGLVPNRASWTNFRAVGRTPEEAVKVLRAVRDLENAGAACIEVEAAPVRLAEHVRRATPMITMGMGCGSVCDTQYLFSSDVLETHKGHYPRHSKTSDDFVAIMAEVQARRVTACKTFAADVASGACPEPRHQVDMYDAA